MPRPSIPTWFFALTVVRRDERFLLVRERKHGQVWYLPAGRVEPGETLAAAALRETREESGLEVRLQGVLRIEHQPLPDGGARVRVYFLAAPADDAPPKSRPDHDSLEAGWFTLEEAGRLSLRGGEVLDALRYVNRGGLVYPLTVLVGEGMPFR